MIRRGLKNDFQNIIQQITDKPLVKPFPIQLHREIKLTSLFGGLERRDLVENNRQFS